MTTQRSRAIILAGGQGRRLGGCEKAWLAHQGQFFIEKILANLQQQGLENICISANRDLARYESLAIPVYCDDLTLPESPLRGIFSAWQAQKASEKASEPGNEPESETLIVPVDVPNQPADLYLRLKKQLTAHPDCQLAIAHDGEQAQQLFLLAKEPALSTIPDYLQSDRRSVWGWCENFSVTYVDFSEQKKCFLNVNTEGDLARLLSQSESSR